MPEIADNKGTALVNVYALVNWTLTLSTALLMHGLYEYISFQKMGDTSGSLAVKQWIAVQVWSKLHPGAAS